VTDTHLAESHQHFRGFALKVEAARSYKTFIPLQ